MTTKPAVQLSRFVVCLTLNLLAACAILSAQSQFDLTPSDLSNHVKLYTEVPGYQVVAGSQVELQIHGQITSGWHIYSTQIPKGGPQATHLKLTSPFAKTIGTLLENAPLIIDDPAVGLRIQVHKKEFHFKQKIQIDAQAESGETNLQGILRYQICDNKLCFPLQTSVFATPIHINPAKK